MKDGLFQGIDSPAQMGRVQGHDDWASWKVMDQVYLTSMLPNSSLDGIPNRHHFPMQNRLKMTPSRSSAVTAPVMRPRA